jgi:hypothetical protein
MDVTHMLDAASAASTPRRNNRIFIARQGAYAAVKLLAIY